MTTKRNKGEATQAQRNARRLNAIDADALARTADMADADLLAARDALRRITRGGDDREQDAASIALATVGRYFNGDAVAAARIALAIARREIALAHVGADSLDAWGEAYGDMVETFAVDPWAGRTPSGWSPSPDAIARTTWTTAVNAALAQVADIDRDAARILNDACKAYAAHRLQHDGEEDPGACQHCDPTTAGRRPSLAGILAHTRQVDSSDAEYHRLRRLMVAALARVDVAALRTEYLPALPTFADHGRPLTPTASASRADADRMATNTHTDITDAVRVTLADGSHAVRSQAAITARADAARKASQERMSATERDADADRVRSDRLADTRAAQAPQGKPRTATRKRGHGSGAYGPQVGARLSR